MLPCREAGWAAWACSELQRAGGAPGKGVPLHWQGPEWHYQRRPPDEPTGWGEEQLFMAGPGDGACEPQGGAAAVSA